MNLAIFSSGSGSNAENIILHFKNKKNVKISAILSNQSDAYVLKRAEKHQIPSFVFTRDDLSSNEGVLSLLKKMQIDFIVLAGFLLKIPTSIIQAYPHKIINIHPSLLPKFGGKNMYGDKVHQAVLEQKETVSGITIHYVNENYDEGQIIFQAKCPVFLEEDTYLTLRERVHSLEYEHYPKIIEKTINKIK